MSRSDQASDSDVRILAPDRITIARDRFGQLSLSVGDACHDGVRPACCRPIADPARHVALFDVEDREIGLIEDIREIDPQSRRVLEEELELRYLVTRIRAVRSIKSRHGVATWDLDTDRGPRVAHVKDRGDIRRLGGGRVIVTDVHGMRFEISDAAALDDRSLALLDAEA